MDEEWVTVLGLESVKEISFKNLSKAKQRLILIARAMIKHLPLLILDEAMINLDNQETAVVVSLIHKIVLERETQLYFYCSQIHG